MDTPVAHFALLAEPFGGDDVALNIEGLALEMETDRLGATLADRMIVY